MEILGPKTKYGRPTRTVVINNSNADLEKFRFHPIEWLRGWFSPGVFASVD
jgi:hypothetical protein